MLESWKASEVGGEQKYRGEKLSQSMRERETGGDVVGMMEVRKDRK